MPAENRGTGEDVVVSGLSGRLPESENIEEFAKNLFDGVDTVTADDRRWPLGESPLPLNGVSCVPDIIFIAFAHF